eukprot:maker-scaffold19_size710362-snap-gene-1.12 protein:Tk00397 transcript:maker-scaffold19_size710362-snap-gene-1.12-mRNA-1 annotation:"polycomb group protein embryonic flower 2-like"
MPPSWILLFGAVAFFHKAQGLGQYCSYLERSLIKSDIIIPDCTQRCGRICDDNPGSYFCTGIHIFTDTRERLFEPSKPQRYTYCICTRSKVRRSPGMYCGPNQADKRDCPNPPADLSLLEKPPSGRWIDGYNTFIPDKQGVTVLRLREAILNGRVARDVGGCNDTLASQSQYRFEI